VQQHIFLPTGAWVWEATTLANSQHARHGSCVGLNSTATCCPHPRQDTDFDMQLQRMGLNPTAKCEVQSKNCVWCCPALHPHPMGPFCSRTRLGTRPPAARRSIHRAPSKKCALYSAGICSNRLGVFPPPQASGFGIDDGPSPPPSPPPLRSPVLAPRACPPSS
jgi:hypothetical protein